MHLTMKDMFDHPGALMGREQLLGVITCHLRKLLIPPPPPQSMYRNY